MKPTGKVALAFSALLLIAAIALQASKPAFTGVTSNAVNLQDTPRHPVTPEMKADALARIGEPAPDFTLPDQTGKPWPLAKNKDLPLVIVMTKDGCPCSIEAQPFFNQLAAHYQGKARFVAAIDSDVPGARNFHTDFSVPYPVLASPSTRFFKQYRSKQSVYTFFLEPGGVIKKVWPGYNKASITELDNLLSRATGLPPAKLDLKMAPEEMTSGCYMFQQVGTEIPAW